MMGDVNQELREFKWFMYGNISDNDGGMHDWLVDMSVISVTWWWYNEQAY